MLTNQIKARFELRQHTGHYVADGLAETIVPPPTDRVQAPLSDTLLLSLAAQSAQRVHEYDDFCSPVNVLVHLPREKSGFFSSYYLHTPHLFPDSFFAVNSYTLGNHLSCPKTKSHD